MELSNQLLGSIFGWGPFDFLQGETRFLELTHLAGLTGLQAPGVSLPLTPQCWDYKQAFDTVQFIWVLRLELKFSCLPSDQFTN